MDTKHDDRLATLNLKEVLRHPDEAFLKIVKEQQDTVMERQPLMSEHALNELVASLGPGPVRLRAPLMQLTARNPYDAFHGLVDIYAPGRWDATSDLMYMDPIVVPNPGNPGE